MSPRQDIIPRILVVTMCTRCSKCFNHDDIISQPPCLDPTTSLHLDHLKTLGLPSLLCLSHMELNRLIAVSRKPLRPYIKTISAGIPNLRSHLPIPPPRSCFSLFGNSWSSNGIRYGSIKQEISKIRAQNGHCKGEHDHGPNCQHDHHHHHHHHHHHCGHGGELTVAQKAVLRFSRAIGWAQLADFLRENLQLCFCAMALLCAAAVSPYFLPKFAVKPFQQVTALLAFPLVGVRGQSFDVFRQTYFPRSSEVCPNHGE